MKKRKLYLDPTPEDGLRVRLDRADERFIASAGYRRDELSAVAAYLREKGVTPEEIAELHAVSGPGRFTKLRIASVIGNVFRFALGTSLFEGRAGNGADKPVARLTPRYGRAPNITRPRRRERGAGRVR